MTEATRLVLLVLMMVIPICCASCGASSDEEVGSTAISEKEAKRALLSLPYTYRFRSIDLPRGADGAIAGVAVTDNGTRMQFGVAFGVSSEAVPVPRAGTAEILGFKNVFRFTNDLQIQSVEGRLIPNPRFKTAKQLEEVVRMEIDITNALCQVAVSSPCEL